MKKIINPEHCWITPRKGTPEHAQVMDIIARGRPKAVEARNVERRGKAAEQLAAIGKAFAQKREEAAKAVEAKDREAIEKLRGMAEKLKRITALKQLHELAAKIKEAKEAKAKPVAAIVGGGKAEPVPAPAPAPAPKKVKKLKPAGGAGEAPKARERSASPKRAMSPMGVRKGDKVPYKKVGENKYEWKTTKAGKAMPADEEDVKIYNKAIRDLDELKKMNLMDPAKVSVKEAEHIVNRSKNLHHEYAKLFAQQRKKHIEDKAYGKKRPIHFPTFHELDEITTIAPHLSEIFGGDIREIRGGYLRRLSDISIPNAIAKAGLYHNNSLGGDTNKGDKVLMFDYESNGKKPPTVIEVEQYSPETYRNWTQFLKSHGID